jgi:multidrug transporter EmrE-like cation transporter
MNWIILIVAGFCEVGFTYCLGRAKSVDGLPWWGWMAGFLVFTIITMGLLAKATQSLPIIQSYQPFKALFMASVGNNRYMEHFEMSKFARQPIKKAVHSRDRPTLSRFDDQPHAWRKPHANPM